MTSKYLGELVDLMETALCEMVKVPS